MPKMLNLFLGDIKMMLSILKIIIGRASIVSNALSYLKKAFGKNNLLKQFAWPDLKQLLS